MCPNKTAFLAAPLTLVAANLLGFVGLFIALHRLEKKERRKLADAVQAASSSSPHVEKTVIVENKGPQRGNPGEAEVVITGPSGTQMNTVTTIPGGPAVVSTAPAGIPGGTVTVDPGKVTVVKAEHPPGKPEEAKIVSTTTHA
ncbi:hypothetical protein K461DRAFT_171923 [Myriangium duriaei CBS 260.36]|uniref:Uncharacterized protein n=1 Tax=Myriangium duriaei CBS 260.36 TaxID=1168546 RepID=A0A9P4J128_9PEZI|nr:hypothetical protein K461DRAFT_171923 [Myriangium duriaei CBS 260.36]